MKPLSLRRMKNAGLPDIWESFLLGPYGESNRVLALQMIVLFAGSKDPEVRKLGYRLALLYTKHTADYSVIHAVASMIGLAPVVKISEFSSGASKVNDNFIGLVREAFSESLREGDIYLTAGQKQLKGDFLDEADADLSVVAPTSYGKSSLMISYVENSSGNFCVIVPTKSLLAQTRRMFLHELPDDILKIRKIITHHEMYDEQDHDIIAVLTQERYLRLLQENPALAFDHLILDESHNLFENEERARALASTIVVTLHRAPDARIKFLSPFIADSENLRNRIHSFDILPLRTDEYVKSELIYYLDYRASYRGKTEQFIYDQFMDRSYSAGEHLRGTPYDYVLDHAGGKNIIYLNRPIKTHEVARKLLASLPNVENEQVNRACKDLGAYLNKDYLLISCIKKGVIFHHGSVPDNVRLYLEKLYATCDDIRFVITTSTLLEGVNLPAEKMFLLDIKKGTRNLSASQLKNLIGRVSRFKEVFSSNRVTGLLPEIHFVGCEHYPRTTINIEAFLKKNLKEGKEAKDKVENPLLEHAELVDQKAIDGLYEELSFIGNAEEDVLEELGYDYAMPKTEIGKLCYLNRIADFNVLQAEDKMSEVVTHLQRLGTVAKDAKQLVEMVDMVFLKNILFEDFDEDSAVVRLRDNVAARDFYSMILQWRTEGWAYQRMIGQFLGYWKKIENNPRMRIVYANTWGTRSRDGNPSHPFKKYVDISKLSVPERVTLAIARIESEMSFLDYNVMKYIDCLRDLGLIDPDYMDQLQFGTADAEMKELIKAGMSHTLAQIVVHESFREHIIHFPSGAVGLSPSVIDVMEEQGINSILINEAEYYTR